MNEKARTFRKQNERHAREHEELETKFYNQRDQLNALKKELDSGLRNAKQNDRITEQLHREKLIVKDLTAEN